MSTQKRNRSKQKHKKSKKPKSRVAVLTLPKTVDLIFPDRYNARLKYVGLSNVSVLTGTSFTTRRFQPTSAFDVDPLLGGTVMPGFTELANLYARYRVHSSMMRTSHIPLSTTGGAMTSFMQIPLNVDPTASPALATALSWFANPYKKGAMLGALGGPTKNFVSHMTTQKMFGSPMVKYDDNFQALCTATPANNWFWTMGWFLATGTTASTVVVDSYEWDITIDVEFFDRVVLVS